MPYRRVTSRFCTQRRSMAKNFLPCGHIREFFAEGRSTTRRISRPFRTATAGGLGPGPPHRVRFGSGESAARHFVVVLDPRTSAGPSVSLGLTYRTLPGLAATLLPSVLPPELPTGMRLVPMVRDWLGLGWTAEHGWSVLEGQMESWQMMPRPLIGNAANWSSGPTAVANRPFCASQ